MLATVVQEHGSGIWHDVLSVEAKMRGAIYLFPIASKDGESGACHAVPIHDHKRPLVCYFEALIDLSQHGMHARQKLHKVLTGDGLSAGSQIWLHGLHHSVLRQVEEVADVLVGQITHPHVVPRAEHHLCRVRPDLSSVLELRMPVQECTACVRSARERREDHQFGSETHGIQLVGCSLRLPSADLVESILGLIYKSLVYPGLGVAFSLPVAAVNQVKSELKPLLRKLRLIGDLPRAYVKGETKRRRVRHHLLGKVAAETGEE
mmetsp:Transcript_34885/g.100236  ORF Transcript_34885/g.100236 Transcript_34885/m.100236 type:complete len:263 (+) Transcript_34885:168-956(+)